MYEPNRLDSKLEQLRRDKHSSLLGPFASYEAKWVMQSGPLTSSVEPITLQMFI